MEQPPELAGLDLGFLAETSRAELYRLIMNCLRLRSNGIEYRMDYGRELGKTRNFLRKHAGERHLDYFDTICEWLEVAPEEARNKIALATTWDQIRIHQETNGLSDRMPALESHVEALFSLELKDRGIVWHEIIARSSEERITGAFILRFLENRKAIEVGAETVGIEDVTKEGYSFDDEIPVTLVSGVPHGTKDAQGITVGEGPDFKLPEEVMRAIDRVSGLCGGDDPELREHWRLAISNPYKIKFEDLLAWAKMLDEEVIKVGRLIHGDFQKGLRDAMRIVARVIDDRTPLSLLKNECLANGGRWERLDGEFKIVITHLH